MELSEKYKKFEHDYDLFDIKIDGVLVWERIRNDIYTEIRQQFGVGQAHPTLDLNTTDHIAGAKLWLRNLFSRNPFLVSESDFIFVGHPRRYKKDDGYYWDIYCDPIYENCAIDKAHFEKPRQLEHHTPAKTDSTRYLEFILYGGTIQRKLGIHDVSLTSKEKKRLNEVEAALQQQFGLKIELVNKVRRVLQNRKCRLWLYELLLDRINPDIAVIVASSGKTTFIEACQHKNVPVVELQHGAIYPAHVVYSFPDERTNTLFPDYLLTWGDFWGKGVQFPIPDDRVLPVGYPYLNQAASQYKSIKTRNQIVFISQGTIGRELSKFAIEVDSHPRINHEIIYKLHPAEYDRWQNRYPWLENANFEIVDSSEPPLYEIFANSSIQVGVNSTAIYEGLYFGLETYIFDCRGTDLMDQLIREKSAKQVTSADELALSLGKKNTQFDSKHYFSPNASDQMCKTLRRLADQGTVYDAGDDPRPE